MTDVRDPFAVELQKQLVDLLRDVSGWTAEERTESIYMLDQFTLMAANSGFADHTKLADLFARLRHIVATVEAIPDDDEPQEGTEHGNPK